MLYFNKHLLGMSWVTINYLLSNFFENRKNNYYMHTRKKLDILIVNTSILFII
jgi:hypothetical protein